MALFKKRKEKELSELPSLSEMPAFPEFPGKEERKIGELPVPVLPSLSKPFDFEQIKMPSMPAMKPITVDISEEKGMNRLKEPIFVKIEKYREALTNLETIKRKLKETSSLLEKIRETRAREEEELELWSQEIDSIKEKIGLIDKKIFSA